MERISYKAIQSDAEYRAKLAEAQVLANHDPDPHSPEGARLLELAAVIEAWEREHHTSFIEEAGE